MNREIYLQMRKVEANHWWFAGRRDIVRDTIRNLPLPTVAQILEAGCGTGGNLAMLAEFGYVSAVEMDEEAAKMAADRKLCAVQKGGLPGDFPYSSPQFDLIVLLDVLEHIEDDIESLKKLESLLLPEGRIIITVPAFPFLWGQHDQAHHHKRRYTARALASCLRKAGLEQEKLSYFNMWLFPLVAVVRLFRYMIPVRSDTLDISIPTPPINSALKKIFSSEHYLLRRMSLPFGVSLIAVGKKRSL